MDSLNAALETLEVSEIIRVATLEPELEYLFRHGLIQDAAYVSLLKQDRRKLHLAVAESLEALYPNRLDDLAAVLARHFDAAGEAERATAFYERAGDAAAARYANREAVNHYTSALALIPEIDAAARYALVLKRMAIYHLIGARDEQREDVRALQALAERLDDPQRRAQAALGQCTYAAAVGDNATAIQAAQDAIRWAQQASSIELEARAQVNWGIVLWKQGELEAARPHLMQALEQARAHHLPEIEADSLRNLGVIADYHGSTAEAWTHIEQALPIYRRLGNRRGEAAVLNSLGVIGISDKRFDIARRYIEQSLAIKRELGDAFGISLSLSNLGVVANEQADYAASQRIYEESLALARSIQDRDGEAAALAGLGAVAHGCGQYAEAWALAEQSLAISREIDDQIGEVSTLLNMSDNLLRNDRAREALTLAEKAFSLAQQIEMREYERFALIRIGMAHQTLGDRAQAARYLMQVADDQDKWGLIALTELASLRMSEGRPSEATPLIESVLTTLDARAAELEAHLRVYWLAHEVLNASGDPRAREVLARGYDRLQAQAARLPEDRRRSFLEKVAEHRAIMAAWEQTIP